ncbi:hypothetical protein MCERE10_03833 [Burkholderiaceae bacterium]
MFRDAVDADLPNIATMADANALLIPPLDQAAFVRMLRWLHEDVVIASGVRSTADTAVVLTIAPRLQMVYEEEQKILAHFGAIPFAMKFGDQRLLSCFAANIVIDESARKKALFFPLQKHFVGLLGSLGYDFSYGLMTRPPVLKPHLAVGWKKIGELKVFARPVAAGLIVSKLFPKLGFQRTLDYLSRPFQFVFDALTVKGRHQVVLTEVDRFDASCEDFLSQWTASQDIAAVRSVDVLNWRFCGFAERNYKIMIARRAGLVCGYMVTRVMPMQQFLTLAVVDLVAMDSDRDAASSLLDAAAALAREAKVDVLTTAFAEHYPFRSLLCRKGFFETAEKFTLVTRVPKASTLELDASIFKRWFINWFDHDFV